MPDLPPRIAAFLEGQRIAVAGVSRSGEAPANAILRRLRDSGHEVIPVNPAATELESETCYPSVAEVPGELHAVMVVTHPADSVEVAQQAIARGIKHVWFHRSFGTGSVSRDAIEVCRSADVEPIVGGCPLMYCQPVDPGHRMFRLCLRLVGRVPG